MSRRLPDLPIGDGAAHPHPTIRAVTGRHLEGDGESVVVGPELHLAVSVDLDVIPDGAAGQGRMWSENVVSTRAGPPVIFA